MRIIAKAATRFTACFYDCLAAGSNPVLLAEGSQRSQQSAASFVDFAVVLVISKPVERGRLYRNDFGKMIVYWTPMPEVTIVERL